MPKSTVCIPSVVLEVYIEMPTASFIAIAYLIKFHNFIISTPIQLCVDIAHGFDYN